MDYGKDQLRNAVADMSAAASRLESIRLALKGVPVEGASGGFDFDRAIPDVGIPYSVIESRIRALPSLFSSAVNTLSLLVAPLFPIQRVRKIAGDLKQKIDQLEAFLADVSQRGGFKTAVWAHIEIGTPDGSVNADFSGRFVIPILGDTDELLYIYNQLLAVFALQAPDFSQAIERATLTLQTIEQTRAKAENATVAAEKHAENATRYAALAEGVLKEMSDYEGTSRRIRDDINGIDAETRAKKSDADATLAAASGLKKEVEDYAATFQRFQTQIDERNTTFVNGRTQLAALIKDHTQQVAAVSQTIERAKSMLATATNAGLTAAQENRYDKLDKELTRAGHAVNFSFFVLFVAILPLAIYVIANWKDTIPFAGGIREYAANVLLRGILLLPSLLFVGFTTFRYRRLFRLKHEYGFRASLAGAVEGFKAQSPAHGDDIAAVAFYQLGRNPAEAIDGDSDKPAWYTKLEDIQRAFSDRFGKSKPSSPPPADGTPT